MSKPHISFGPNNVVYLHIDYGCRLDFESIDDLKEFAKTILQLVKVENNRGENNV